MRSAPPLTAEPVFLARVRGITSICLDVFIELKAPEHIEVFFRKHFEYRGL